MSDTTFDEAISVFGDPIVAAGTGDHILVVAELVDGDLRVARLLYRVEFEDRLDLTNWLAEAEHSTFANAHEAFQFMMDEGWVGYERTPDQYKGIWIALAKHDLDLDDETATALYEQIVEETGDEATEDADGEKLRISDAYAGEHGSLLITGSRGAIESVMQTISAFAP